MTDFITCTVCGTENAADSEYCEHCSAPLQAAPDVAVEPIEEIASIEVEVEPLSAEENLELDDDFAAEDSYPEVVVASEPSFAEEEELLPEIPMEAIEPSEPEVYGADVSDAEEDAAEEVSFDADEAADEFAEEIEPQTYEGEFSLDEDSVEDDFVAEEASFDADADADADDWSAEEQAEEPEPEPPRPSIAAERTTERVARSVLPLPEPGPHPLPASLTIFFDQQMINTVEVEESATLLGNLAEQIQALVAGEHTAEDEEESGDEHVDFAIPAPGIDLSSLGVAGLAKKHAAIFRQNKNYTLYVLSDQPTQLNDEILGLGERRALKDGDVILLAQEIALRFELPAA